MKRPARPDRIPHLTRCCGLAALTLSSLLWGCQSGEQTSSWSSKSQSTETSLGNVSSDGIEVSDITNRSVAVLRADALTLLEQAVESLNPVLRANAIEGLQHSLDAADTGLRAGLVDDNRGVRFVATMLVGRYQARHMLPLVTPLQHDSSDSVRAAALYALRRCGQRVDLSPLAEMIVSQDPEVRGNAALVLGELGDRTAIPLLRQSVNSNMQLVDPIRSRVIDLQVAEAMVKLGAQNEIEIIRAALFSPEEQGELAALACIMCGDLSDGRAVGNMIEMATREGNRQKPAEVRMAATLGVAKIDARRAPVHVPLEYVRSESFALRAQAASTLGWCEQKESLAALSVLMRDTNPQVQVAAAASILRLTR